MPESDHVGGECIRLTNEPYLLSYQDCNTWIINEQILLTCQATNAMSYKRIK